jgi:hypothetical protein
MLMAWLTDTGAGVGVVHAAPDGGPRALCGDPVDEYGPVWPHPDQDWADSPGGRQRCPYCVRLMREG